MMTTREHSSDTRQSVPADDASGSGIPLSCIVIGEGTLARVCAQRLRAGGSHIHAIVTRDGDFSTWARETKIPVFAEPSELPKQLSRGSFGYLFSIVNPRVLGQEVLNLPAIAAINYHDAPLPFYAGNNATSWALMDQRTEHGVSWHLMTSKVDGGDVILQQPVPISAEDTALSLNLKCYEAAIESFGRLLSLLERGQLAARSQENDARTFFSRYRRPPGGGYLRWDRPAESLSAMIRGLDFGPGYANPLGLPKIVHGGEAVIVSKFLVRESGSGERPGTIVSLDATQITVTSATLDVAVLGLRQPTGEPLDIAQWCARHELSPGRRFDLLGDEAVETLTRAHERSAVHEQFWLERLTAFSVPQLPYGIQSNSNRGFRQERSEWTRSPNVEESSGEQRVERLIAALLIYLVRVSMEKKPQIAFLKRARADSASYMRRLFSPVVPLQIGFESTWNFGAVETWLRDERRRIGEASSYPCDLIARYPQLRGIPELRSSCPWPVALDVVDFPGAEELDSCATGGLEDTAVFQVRRSDGSFRWLFNSACTSQEHIGNITGHLLTLLRESVKAETLQQPVQHLALLGQAERHRLLREWNDTAVDLPSGKMLHQLFEEQALLQPQAIALIYEDAYLSYEELNRRSNRLAHHLAAKDVGIGTPIGICIPQSPEMIIGLLGILKAGGAYVPLDPNLPAERLRYMLRDSGARQLLTGAGPVTWLDDEADIAITELWGASSPQLDLRYSADNVDMDVPEGGANPVYVIYTSGSTGRPRGVLVEHASLINTILDNRQRFNIQSGSRLLYNLTISFDAASKAVWMALSRGASLILIDNVRVAGWLLQQKIIASRATHLMLPPVSLRQLESEKLSGIDTVITGGESCPDELAARWSQLAPFFNAYGPTETTICSLVKRIRTGEQVVIGRPIANTRVYILDENLELMPTGATGELYIGGVGLARGYINEPALTSRKFIHDPFGTRPDDRLYRTGDLVRYLANGDLAFVGRTDDQVKIRGFRIELDEIKGAVLQHESISDAALLIREDEPGNKALVAYVVKAPSPSGEARDPLSDDSRFVATLRKHLQGRLPAYMVPSAIVVLPALPVTANNKVDYRALPAPDARGNRVSYVAPEGLREELLAGLWCQILRLEQVGRYDNFFALGGHSLSATQLASRIRDVFSVELPISELFEKPTLQEQAGALNQARLAEVQYLSPVDRAPRDNPLLLSYAQQRLWFLSRYLGPSGVYNMRLALRLRGRLDTASLTRALHAIVSRHEALRTRFETRDGTGIQVIDPAPPQLEVEWVADGKELNAICQHERNYPFDVSSDNLCRIRLLALRAKDEGRGNVESDSPGVAVGSGDDTEHVLLITMHHGISDGWSMTVFTRELVALYTAYSAGRASPLIPLAIQYADYAHWQRQHTQGDALDRQLSYWREKLTALPALSSFPSDRPRPPEQTFEGDELPVHLSPGLRADLQALCKQQGVTLFMTLLAAFSALLGRYAGQDEVAIGTPIANRTLRETEDLIGFFVNTLVMRSDLRGDPRFVDLLKQSRDTALQAYANQDVPFELLVEELRPERSTSYSPLFQVMFTLQNVPPVSISLPGVEVTPFVPDRNETDVGGVSRFDLTLTLEEGPAGIAGYVEYNTDLFDRATIAEICAHYSNLLQAIVKAPQARLSQLELFDETQRRNQLDAWNGEQASYFPGCVHELFERQVELRGDSLALVCAHEHLTFDALDRRANRLARHLARRGVKAEDRVGLFFERSNEMVVGMLGVLKAGGCYVPIDPAYPADRIHYVATDSGFEFILCDSSLVPRLNGCRGHVIAVDDEVMVAELRTGDSQNLRARNLGLGPDSACYLVYTSGSTGRSKGVIGVHRSVVNRVNWLARTRGVERDDVLCQKTTVAFVDHVAEIFQALCGGVPLVIVSDETVRTPAAFMKTLDAWKITQLTLVPSLLHVLIGNEGTGIAPALRAMNCSGEALRAPEIADFRRHFPRARLYNIYGSTEVGADVSCHELTGEPVATQKQAPAWAPIGRAIDNSGIFVLDSHGQLCPRGAAGEIHVAGAGLSRGYLNRASLTAEKFVPDPFSNVPGARLYRTGDFGRYRADGNLEYVGRLDHQVKVRGFRIEPGEIEACLQSFPGVGQCVVDSYGSAPDGKQLVAYVVPDARPREAEMEMSLFFFAAGEFEQEGDKYRLYLDAAKRADELGFTAVWTPERHFHQVAGLYPSPSVLSSALAMLTSKIQLRAGSVVLPLHNPLRVAEEWSVVDNLSQGRVGLSFVSGWVPDDFALFPENFHDKRSIMFHGIEQVRALWRGEKVTVKNGLDQHVELRIFPSPVQNELPTWLTCTGDPEMFRKAGKLGMNVLTALLVQTVEEAAEKIRLYRQALSDNGYDPSTRTVTMMLHTFLNSDADTAIELAREPFCNYMKSHLGLIRNVVESMEIDNIDLNDGQRLDELAHIAYQRYLGDASLIGSPASCQHVLAKMKAIGVDEIACLIDFGVAADSVVESLDVVNELRQSKIRSADPHLDDGKMAEFLRARLPEYMVPATFVFLDELPLNPNGKVNRRALPQPDQVPRQVEYVPPQGTVELVLADLWRERLNVRDLGRLDNFFKLGGHSLMAMQLLSRIQDVFSVELSIRSLFEKQRLQDQAALIEQQQRGGEYAVRPIPILSRSEPLQLSYSQQRLWFLHQYMGPNAIYNIPVVYRLRGEVNVDALIKSINEIFFRHESLRTRFEAREGTVVQVIDPPAMILALEGIDSRDRIASICRTEREYPFDLSRDRLCRIRLLRDESGDAQSYLLAVTLHHSIADAWSVGLFFRELAALYHAFRRGENSPLPPLEIQYVDYAQWQRQSLQSEILEKQLAYWRARLKDLSPLLRLPTDKPRPAAQSYNGNYQPISLPRELTAQLRMFAREHNVTLYMVLLASFAVLLGRYADEDDVAIGSPVVNRVRKETEALIGFFVNSLVMRADMRRNPSFKDFVQRVRETALQAYAHMDLPFEKLVEELHSDRNLSYSPLFQVSFSLINTPNDKVSLDDLDVLQENDYCDGEARFARLDLTLNVAEVADHIEGGLEYNADLFERTTMERMMAHYERLLEYIIVQPQTPIFRLEFLSDQEKLQQLAEWNHTARDPVDGQCFHELIEAQVAARPDGVALVHGPTQLTYGELNRRANQLARYLMDCGVGPESQVGLCIGRSLEMLVGLLGILKAGGCYVPLDPEYPEKRLTYMLEESGCRIVLTERHLLEELGFLHEVRTVPLDGELHETLFGAYPSANIGREEARLSSANLAYVIYTSGSTGLPKGTGISHEGWTNLARAQVERFGVDCRVRGLQFASLSFDAAAFEISKVLGNGGTLCLISETDARSPEKLTEVISCNQVTHATLPPTVLSRLHPDSIRAIRTLIVAGEAISREAARNWAVSRRFFNAYGPTETTVCATAGQYEEDVAHMGTPLRNQTCYVLGKGGQLQPAGIPGELYVGGRQVARGYLGRPALTAEKFVPNPFATEPGERLYRTGDLVRYLPLGDLEFIGRIDHQVKLRGFRIELGEVEHALLEMPEVGDAAVMVHVNETDNGQLVAFVVIKTLVRCAEFDDQSGSATNHAPSHADELRRKLRRLLPAHMLPSAIVELPAFPLMPNGKVDRKALLTEGTRAHRKEYISPETATEKALSALWREILSCDAVGRYDNFFGLGGHSLLAMQLVSRVKETFDVNLSLQSIFEYPVLKDMSSSVESALRFEQLDDTSVNLMTEEEAEHLLKAIESC